VVRRAESSLVHFTWDEIRRTCGNMKSAPSTNRQNKSPLRHQIRAMRRAITSKNAKARPLRCLAILPGVAGVGKIGGILSAGNMDPDRLAAYGS